MIPVPFLGRAGVEAMSVVRVWSRSRRKVFLASVMPAGIIGIPLALLLISQLSSLGRLERASQQVLTQTAIRVAEELAREIRRDLGTVYTSRLETLPGSAIRGWDLETLRAALDRDQDAFASLGLFLIGTLASGGAPSPGADVPAMLFYGTPDPLGAQVAYGAFTGTAPAGARPIVAGGGRDFSVRPALAGAVADCAAYLLANGFGEGSGSVTVGGQRYLMLLRFYRADERDERLRRVAGFAVPVEELTRRYFASVATKMRSPDQAFSTDQPLEVSILDETGREIYRTGPSLRSRYIHEAPLLLSLAAEGYQASDRDQHAPAVVWTIRSGYPGTDPAALARSSTNQQRQLLFLVTVVAAVGILLSGRAVARELGVAELKAEFVSSVSHDLKTPLASIQILADILNAGGMSSPEKVRGYGKVIGSETRKLGKLIEGILEFDRIDTGGRHYIVEEIDLRDPVRQAVGEFGTQLKETGFRTQLRLPPRQVPFVGNADALLHAFGNVIGNAIKYSAGEKFLKVVMREADGNAVIEVHDHGTGIPASERSRIFDRFYRVRRDPGTDPAGTGLGLPIAQHVIRSHGGRISVAGSPGGGSVFTIEIPLADATGSDAGEQR